MVVVDSINEPETGTNERERMGPENGRTLPTRFIRASVVDWTESLDYNRELEQDSDVQFDRGELGQHETKRATFTQPSLGPARHQSMMAARPMHLV